MALNLEEPLYFQKGQAVKNRTSIIEGPSWMLKCIGGACLMAALLAMATPALAEQCVAGVHAMAPWTAKITGNAKDWPDNAKSLGFKVDHVAQNGAVLIYPKDYGSGIDPTNGHAALIVNGTPDKNGRITIKDSNGICGGDRKQCTVRQPDWARVWVIHPK